MKPVLRIPPAVVKTGSDTLGWRGAPYETLCVSVTPVFRLTIVPDDAGIPVTTSLIMSRAGGLATGTVLRRADLWSDRDC